MPNNGNSAPYTVVSIEGSSSSGISGRYGSGTSYVANLGNLATTTYKDYVAALSVSSTAWQVFVNGVQTGTGTATIPNATYGTSPYFGIGNGPPSQSRYSWTVIYWAGLWNTYIDAITLGAMTEGVSSIFQIFEPPSFNWLLQGVTSAAPTTMPPYLVFPSMYFPSMIEE